MENQTEIPVLAKDEDLIVRVRLTRGTFDVLEDAVTEFILANSQGIPCPTIRTFRTPLGTLTAEDIVRPHAVDDLRGVRSRGFRGSLIRPPLGSIVLTIEEAKGLIDVLQDFRLRADDRSTKHLAQRLSNLIGDGILYQRAKAQSIFDRQIDEIRARASREFKPTKFDIVVSPTQGGFDVKAIEEGDWAITLTKIRVNTSVDQDGELRVSWVAGPNDREFKTLLEAESHARQVTKDLVNRIDIQAAQTIRNAQEVVEQLVSA